MELMIFFTILAVATIIGALVANYAVPKHDIPKSHEPPANSRIIQPAAILRMPDKAGWYWYRPDDEKFLPPADWIVVEVQARDSRLMQALQVLTPAPSTIGDWVFCPSGDRCKPASYIFVQNPESV